MVKNRSTQYPFATTASSLDVPVDLDSDTIVSLLPIPAVKEEQQAQWSPGTPSAPAALLTPEIFEQIRIQSLSNRNWMVSPENPSTVWPRLILFFADSELSLERTEPINGLLETSWFNLETQSSSTVQKALQASEEGKFYRVRLRIEQAIKRGFSEIHVRIFAIEDPEDWQPSEDEGQASQNVAALDREIAFLKVLAASLLRSDERTSVSLMADAINAKPKATLLWNDEQQPSLQLNLDNERFFATIHRSLKNAGVTVVKTSDDNSILQIAFDKELRGRQPKDSSLRQSRGKRDGLELHLRWEDQQGYVDVLAAKKSKPVTPEYAEQVLLLIREYSL